MPGGGELLNAPVDWASTRLVAGVLLCVYAAVAVVQFGREARFLAGVEHPQRGWFIVQDILIQLAVLLCLLPVALSPTPSKGALLACISGLTGLWLAGIWTVFTRRVYTYRLLLGARGEHKKLIAELLQRGGEAPEQQAEKEDG